MKLRSATAKSRLLLPTQEARQYVLRLEALSTSFPWPNMSTIFGRSALNAMTEVKRPTCPPWALGLRSEVRLALELIAQPGADLPREPWPDEEIVISADVVVVIPFHFTRSVVIG